MTDAVFTFRVPGHCVGKGRPRVVAGGRRTFTPPKTEAYERSVALLARAARPRGWPLEADTYSVELAIYERLGKGGGRRGPPPDVDNVGKAVLDGLIGSAYADDGLVNRLVIDRWSTTGQPCVLVTVRHGAAGDPS